VECERDAGSEFGNDGVHKFDLDLHDSSGEIVPLFLDTC
jgi:hypothetical protein